MIKPTIVTWVLSIIGVIIYLPALYIQTLAICKPYSQKVKDMLVGKGGDYHDKTYFNFCQGTGWADLTISIPLAIIGSIAVLSGQSWGYMIWFAGAFITIYIHFVLIFIEGKHIYTKWCPLAFFTYAWGIWVYWAIVVIIYSLIRINEIVQ